MTVIFPLKRVYIWLVYLENVAVSGLTMRIDQFLSFLYYKWFVDMRSNQQHVNSTIIKHNGSA